jgi:hypothetical protein
MSLPGIVGVPLAQAAESLRAALAAAVEVDATKRHGLAMGLSDAESRDVIGVWVTYYQTTPDPVPWEQVRRAMTRRALDQSWRPLEWDR